MDGSEVRIKDEDILKHWVKMSSNGSNKVKKNVGKATQSSQIKQDLSTIKNINVVCIVTFIIYIYLIIYLLGYNLIPPLRGRQEKKQEGKTNENTEKKEGGSKH